MRLKKKYNNFIKEKIIKFINQNFKQLSIVILLFIIGIIFGTVLVQKLGQETKEELKNYFESYINKENLSEISNKKVFMNAIKNYMLFSIIVWIAGLTVIGIPVIYANIFIKGLGIGYTISIIIGIYGKIKGIKFSIISMLSQNLIMVPILIIFSIFAINLSKNIIKNRRNENIKIDILKYNIWAIIYFILNIFVAIIETFISTNLIKVLC
jgi:stage II sporulation protein M